MQDRQAIASSASEIDRIAAARADATRSRSRHVVRAMLSLVIFPALGWGIAIAFGKAMAMLAVGVGLLALTDWQAHRVARLLNEIRSTPA